MSGLGLAVICVAFILNEKTTEKNTNDLLYIEPDDPNFEEKKKKNNNKCMFPPLRRFYFDEMERFYQIPHTSALFIYLIILKVQYSSDEDFQLKIPLHKKYKLFLKPKEVVC